MDCWVDTDAFGAVVDASREGARVFNLTVSGLRGRSLSTFFLERQRLFECLRAVRSREVECHDVDLICRPAAQRPQRVSVSLRPVDYHRVRWHIGRRR